MTFETIDWEAEAKRVAAAFGLSGEYAFEQQGKIFSHCRVDTLDGGGGFSLGRRGCVVVVRYWEGGRHFRVASEHLHMDSEDDARLTIDWEGGFSGRGRGWGDDTSEVEVEELARGLFHLGLLTPAIEAHLKLELTAHERMEWEVEGQVENDI